MGAVLTYTEAVTQAMGRLAQHPRTLFVGQSVRYDGQRLHQTLRDVPMDRRIEFPVIEDCQMGFCLGLALEGFIPVSIFPRWDFLLLAANQLVNHLDKVPSGFEAKIIIRTAVAATWPLDPGPQHCQDHTTAFRFMLKHVEIRELAKTEDVLDGYAYALAAPHSVLLVEQMSRYV